MHPRVLSDDAWATVGSLANDEVLDGWILAGGTGLALHFGHRYSEALDLFRSESFDPDRLAVSMSSVGDIAVMKVVAIGGRGSRKDFVDLYFYLRSGATLDGVFTLLERRFAGLDYNEYHLLKSLAYFEDAESEPMPNMIRDVEWAEIRDTLESEVLRLS